MPAFSAVKTAISNLVLLVMVVSASSHLIQPNRFSLSGTNLALSSTIPEKFIRVFKTLCKTLEDRDEFLQFSHKLNISGQEKNKGYYDWIIKELNIQQLDFNEKEANFVYLEPTQEVKLYLPDISFNMTWLSVFKPHGLALTYNESGNMSVYVTKMTFSTSFNLKFQEDKQALQISISKIGISGQADNILIWCDKQGFFNRIICLFAKQTKAYYMDHIDAYMTEYSPFIEQIVNMQLVEISQALKNFTVITSPLTKANFNFMPSIDTQHYLPNPIIYDNFMSFRTLGQMNFDKDINQSDIQDESNRQSSNYLPLYQRNLEDSEIQLFVSQFTVNEMLLAYQNSVNYTYQTSKILDQNCNTFIIDVVLKGFSSKFGSFKKCKLRFNSEKDPLSVNIVTGDLLFKQFKTTLTILVENDEMVLEKTISLDFWVDELVIGLNMCQKTDNDAQSDNITTDFKYFYEVKNFNVTRIEQTDDSGFMVQVEDLKANILALKDLIIENFTKLGKEGHLLPLYKRIQPKYSRFLTQTFRDSQLTIKDEYLVLTSAFSSANTIYYEDKLWEFISRINKTQPLNFLSEWANENVFDNFAQHHIQQQKTQRQLDYPWYIYNNELDSPKEMSLPYHFASQIQESYKDLSSFISLVTSQSEGETTTPPHRIKKPRMFVN